MARQTVQQILDRKGSVTQESIRKLVYGKVLIVLSVAGGHNYGPVGTKFKCNTVSGVSLSPSNGTSSAYGVLLTGRNSMNLTNVALAEETLEDLQEQIKDNLETVSELNSDNEIITQKIEFMSQNSLKEFDDDLFKTFAILGQLENKKLSKLEKARLIAGIVKQ